MTDVCLRVSPLTNEDFDSDRCMLGIFSAKMINLGRVKLSGGGWKYDDYTVRRRRLHGTLRGISWSDMALVA
jgi:hypothetical protein